MDIKGKNIIKIKKVLENNWEKICFYLGILFYFSYVIYAYEEVPFETYINKLYLVEPFYNHTLTFKELLSTYAEHGMLAANIIFLFNLKVFHYSILFENLVNVCLVSIVGGAILKFCKENVRKRDLSYYISILIMTFFLFTLMQQGGGGMSLQVRMGLTSFVLVSFMIDKVLRKEKVNAMYVIFTLIFIVLSINVFGTMYSFAAIPFVILVTITIFVREKKISVANVLICMTYIFSVMLYLVEYGFTSGTGSTPEGTVGIFEKIIACFTNVKSTILALVCWCGSSVLGRATIEDGHISNMAYYLIGGIVCSLFVVSIIVFCKYKIYKETYLPILWIGYYFSLYGLLLLGRDGQGAMWFTSSWYIVHSKIAICGMLYNFLYVNLKSSTMNKVMLNLVQIGILLMVLCGTYYNIERLPAEKRWLKDHQAYFFAETIEELPVDETGMTPLFQNQEVSWNAIQILKKYHLSLFKNYDSYEEMKRIRETQISKE